VLLANFPAFINVLQNIEGGLPNVHIGVVSTDLGSNPFNIGGCNNPLTGHEGRLMSDPRLPGCSPPSGAFIRDIALPNGERDRNYTGSLADTFTCIAALGEQGCGFEQPLEAMRKALDNNPANAGFIRPNAFLAVIFLTDEDDCSVTDGAMFDNSQNSVDDPLGPLASYRCTEFGIVCDPDTPRTPGVYSNCRPRENSPYMAHTDEYANFLKGLKDDPRMIIVSGIIGNPNPVVVALDANNRPTLQPSCMTGGMTADPGVRLQSFLDQFPQRNTVTTICSTDLTDGLVLIAQLMASVIGNPCVTTNILDENGDYECQVSDIRFPGEDRQEETIIPECNADRSNIPCWHFEAQDSCDAYPTGLALIVERGGGSVPTGTHVYARCVIHD
jgi:hypothetical protein